MEGRGPLLPPGSVVSLAAGGDHLVMVVGRGNVTEVRGEKGYFDYTGLPYPQGVGERGEYLFFNREDVGEVVFFGYSNAVEQEFEASFDAVTEGSGYRRLSVSD